MHVCVCISYIGDNYIYASIAKTMEINIVDGGNSQLLKNKSSTNNPSLKMDSEVFAGIFGQI